MYIEQSEFKTDVYPFATNRQEATFQMRITVPAGRHDYVYWNGERWTPEEFEAYQAKLKAAFDKAFEILRRQ